MIQIRESCFETNSSGCHIFMFPHNMDIKVPKTVFLNDEHNTVDNMPNLFFNDCNWGEEYTTPFIQFLYKCGVETIIYLGKHQYVKDAIERFKMYDCSNCEDDTGLSQSDLKKVCFGIGVKVIERSTDGGYDFNEEVKKEGDFEDWCSYRLS